jgi:hypothetical protein
VGEVFDWSLMNAEVTKARLKPPVVVFTLGSRGKEILDSMDKVGLMSRDKGRPSFGDKGRPNSRDKGRLDLRARQDF